MQHVIKQKTEQSETSATAPQVRSSGLPSLGLFSASLHHIFHLFLSVPCPFLYFLSLPSLFQVYLPCSVCVNLAFCCYSFPSKFFALN